MAVLLSDIFQILFFAENVALFALTIPYSFVIIMVICTVLQHLCCKLKPTPSIKINSVFVFAKALVFPMWYMASVSTQCDKIIEFFPQTKLLNCLVSQKMTTNSNESNRNSLQVLLFAMNVDKLKYDFGFVIYGERS